MRIEDEYRLSQYQDLGELEGRAHVRLMRNRVYGDICVRKRVPASLEQIYRFMETHPSAYIPRIRECIADGGSLIVIEEYIAGRNLEEHLAERLFSEEEAMWILRELCRALEPFHHARPPIVCRDLKPENIMLDASARVKIVDFNIARVYQEGQSRDTRILGTAEYAAPEQYGFFQTDARTDIYALGILLNYLILRKYPAEQMISGRLGQIVGKCTQMDPADRYQSVEELERELRTFSSWESDEQESPGGSRRKSNSSGNACESGTQRNPGGEFRVRRNLPGEPGTQVNDSRKNVGEMSFLPPGFRTRTWWKMITAIFGYGMLTYLCATLELTTNGVLVTGPALRLQQGMIWLSQILFIGVVCNYRNCRKYMPILNQKNRFVRVMLYVLLDMALFFLAALACGVLEMVLF